MPGQRDAMPLVLVPSSFDSNQRGKFFEGIVADLLRKQRYQVIERVRFTGMEIDVLADHKDTRQRAYVECKFQRDPFGSDVIDKLLGKGMRKGADLVYLFSVSEPGSEAKGVIDELTRSAESDGPRFAYVGPEGIVDSLLDLRGIDAIAPEMLEGLDTGGVHLVVIPDSTPFWVVEQLESGLPARRLVVGDDPPALAGKLDTLRSLFEDNGMLEGLPMEVYGASGRRRHGRAGVAHPQETVTPVVTADSLVDYRPCRPQDFVGRDGLQREVWTHLERVRMRESASRIIALSGPSGFGKSSTVVKLSDRFGNVRWKNRFFLHSVDSRAAEGPLFVAAAVKAALEQAIGEGFLGVELENVRIHSSDSILDSPDVARCLEWLETERRVLVLFFDQFEEMLYKQELQPVFEAFRRLAFEANASNANFVLGFSWRTGITLPDGNPAYHVWHSLRDIRVNLVVDRFLGKESSGLVTLFQQALGQAILRPLRRRLIEQGQGIPWLLKKLCIHVYREIARGTSQYELLERRLNIETLFEEDLQLLSSETESACLRFIAENSPVALNEVAERFGEDTLNTLYENRLIVRAGQRYAIYWDVFRDYLKGEPPPIPWSYVPVVSVSMAMKGFRALQQTPGMDLASLARELGYAEKTMLNIVGDLQNLALITRAADGRYEVHPDLKAASAKQVASYSHELFEDHIATRALRGAFSAGQLVGPSEFGAAIQGVYTGSGVPLDYARRYAKKLKPWLRFAGYVDRHHDRLSVCGSAPGRDLGVFAERSSGPASGKHGWLFLGTAAVERVVYLAIELTRRSSITRREIIAGGDRNAADDLRSLGLARWEDQSLKAAGELASTRIQEWDAGAELVARAAAATPFGEAARRILSEHPRVDSIALGERIAAELEKAWSEASKRRYGGAGKRWARFVEKALLSD
jgi:Holliday junction resolvase-like predicted endonuclease